MTVTCWPAPVVRVKPEADTLLTVPAATWPKGPASIRPPGMIRPGRTIAARGGAMILTWPPAGTTACLSAPGGTPTAIRAADGAAMAVTDGVVSPVTDTATRAPASAAAATQPAARLVSTLPARRAPPCADGPPAPGGAVPDPGGAVPAGNAPPEVTGSAGRPG